MDRVLVVIAASLALLTAACGGTDALPKPGAAPGAAGVRDRVKLTSTSAVTYGANCGHTSYLEYKADHWSAGCMAGSLNATRIAWNRWSSRAARGRGRVELRDPGCRPTCPKAKIFRYPARITLSHPRTCRSDTGVTRRYFSRVTVHIKWRAKNPFDEPAGWRAEKTKIGDGSCALAP